MRKQAKRRIILIDGIRYYDDKPKNCRECFFWKNRKAGCILGKQNSTSWTINGLQIWRKETTGIWITAYPACIPPA